MFRVFLSRLTVIISVIVILTSLGQEPLTGINDFTKMKKIEREEKKAIKVMCHLSTRVTMKT